MGTVQVRALRDGALGKLDAPGGIAGTHVEGGKPREAHGIEPGLHREHLGARFLVVAALAQRRGEAHDRLAQVGIEPDRLAKARCRLFVAALAQQERSISVLRDRIAGTRGGRAFRHRERFVFEALLVEHEGELRPHGCVRRIPFEQRAKHLLRAFDVARLVEARGADL